MEIIDIDRATDTYDAYSGRLTTIGDAITSYLNGGIQASLADHLLRLEQALRKTFREASIFSIMLSEHSIQEMPLLVFQPAKLAKQVSAKTRLLLEIRRSVEILARVDAAKPKIPAKDEFASNP